MSLVLVELGVEDGMLDAAAIEQARELFGALDGNGAHQHRLALGMASLNVVGDSVELGIDSAVDQVIVVHADNGLVGRNHLNGELVDLAELGILGQSGTSHAGKLVVQAEVVL